MKMLCSVQLSKHRYKTPEGYLVCKDCIIARTGKQTYLKSELYGLTEGEDEYIEVDRKEKEVFDEKTLASFEGKPLTIEHPDVSVSPENYKELSVGNVHNVHRGEFEGQPVMFADINVYDAKAIDLIESGEMEELSCGYDCDITDGENPEQINIRGNHVALCEQGRAGIAKIQDSYKNKVDTKHLDMLISYQYRTDESNDLDMSEFVTRFLGETLPNELSRQPTKEEKEYVKARCKEWFKDSWGIKPVIKDSVQKGTLIQEFGRYGDQYKITKIQGNVLYCEELNTGKTFLFKKDKENVDWAIITKSEVKDSVSHNKDLLSSEKKHWTIDLDRNTIVFNGKELNSFGGGHHEHRFSGNVYDNLEEAVADAKKLFEEYKDKKEITDNKYDYYSVNIIEWQNSGGNHVDENGNKIGVSSTFSAYDKNELKGAIREEMKRLNRIRDEDPKKYTVYYVTAENHDYMVPIEHASLGKAKEVFKETVEMLSNQRRRHSYLSFALVFLIEDSEYFIDKPQIASAEIDEKGFATIWMADSIKDPSFQAEDSFAPLFVISLGEGEWLDSNDRPTSRVEEAKKFATKEDAEEYKRIYCKGTVCPLETKISDSVDMSKEADVIGKLLEGIDYEEIAYDDAIDSIKISFDDKKELRKAAKKLISEYEIELNESDKGSLSIMVYDKFEEKHGVSDAKDSFGYSSYEMTDGKPAEAFKRYLKERNMVFADIKKGKSVCFKVKDSDRFADKEAMNISLSLDYVKTEDGYSKKFYAKAIDILKAKLEKLEKNELLDSNQNDYQEQKESMKREIDRQIKEYTAKINAI